MTRQPDLASPSKLIFVPGAGCEVLKDYPKTCDAFEKAAFDITTITPDWDSGASFEELVAQVSQEVACHIGASALVVAHSRGANLVMPALVQQPNIGVIIASPSMTCAEGCENSTALAHVEERFPSQEQQVRKVGMHALAQASQIPPAQAAVMVGSQEIVTYPFMADIARATAEGFNVDLMCIPQAAHFIDNYPPYIDMLVSSAVLIRAHMA